MLMSLRDLHTFLSSLNQSRRGVLQDTTLMMAKMPQYDCHKISSIAVTPLDTLEPITNWSLLGPLVGNKLYAAGAFGQVSVIEQCKPICITFQDKMLMHWTASEKAIENHPDTQPQKTMKTPLLRGAALR